MPSKKSQVPYAGATSGEAARREIIKILKRFGCSSIGFMDEFERHELLLVFVHRGRNVQLRASAKGWAELYLKENPWSGLRKSSREEYERAAILHGLIAVNSILRDWVKGQVTAVETGILSFEAVFMPYMMTNEGRTMLEVVQNANLLPPPTEETK